MKRLLTKFIAAAFAVILTLCCMSVIYPTARAESDKKEYSNVLNDLKKDSTFDISHYPENSTDYSLSVVQLAESEDKELFVYVYQPSGQTKKLVATSINISTSSEIDIKPHNYALTLLNSEETLFKYKVDDFTVNSEPARYYAVPSIYRAYDKDLGDKEAENNNTISEVPFEVAKQWCFSQINGKPYCSVTEIETIVVENKYIGFVRYDGDGFKFGTSAARCDRHFVAFSTNRSIDKIIEADVQYVTQSWEYNSSVASSGKITFGSEKKTEYVELNAEVEDSYTGRGWHAKTFKWKQIESVSDFIESIDSSKHVIYSGVIFDVSEGLKLSNEEKAKLKSYDWVLNFAVTDYSQDSSQYYVRTTSTLVGDVTILRLKYVYEGVTYNLGVIDNKQTGERDSSGLPVPIIPIESIGIDLSDGAKGCLDSIGKLLPIILGLLFFVILLPFVPMIIRGITFIVTLPYKTVKRSKERKREQEMKKIINGNKNPQKSKKIKKGK